jgi:hypothetical protein
VIEWWFNGGDKGCNIGFYGKTQFLTGNSTLLSSISMGHGFRSYIKKPKGS